MYSLIIAIVMFGFNFYFNQQYVKEQGYNKNNIISFTLFQSIFGLIVLLIINQFKFEFTLFSFLIAILSSVNAILCTVFGLKSFKYVNLSFYSICSMLGGMILPTIVGFIFFNEDVTLAKIICIILVIISLLIGFKKDKTTKENKLNIGNLYCFGIFITNGMSGVLSTIFTLGQYEKVSKAGFSILIAVCTIVIMGIIYLCNLKNANKYTLKTWGFAIGSGVFNKVANYLLLIALAVLPASIEYPLVTIGVMIVSTLISLLTKQKVDKKNIISLIIASLGILALIIIKI